MFLQLDSKKKEKIAVIDNDNHVLSYGDLIDEMNRLSSMVQSRAVAFVMCNNEAGALIGYLGFIHGDVVPLVLSSKIDREQLQKLISIYMPRYIWASEKEFEYLSYLRVYSTCGYQLLMTDFDIYSVHKDLQFLMATSGSTGSPKLVRYKKGNLEANARNVALAFGWSERERAICDLGMQYTMGLNVINTHLYVGATILLTTYNLMDADFWEFIKENKGTNFTGVPFSYEILHRLHFETMELPELYTLSQGGGKLKDSRFMELAEYAAVNEKRFIASFGTTETAARMAYLPSELALEKTGSIGKAIPEGELFLIDMDGNEINSVVAEGELGYRGPNVTMGYATTKDELMNGDDFQGEYHTGDMARRDQEGCYYIIGRKTRFLKLLSYRVSLDECERLISERFDMECVCTGTDEKMDIYICNGDLVNDVQSFMARKLNLYRNLFRVKVIDTIPRNESGKIKYKDLP